MTVEKSRLEATEAGVPWRKWGPYLSERQWGTVREDYSAERRRLGLLHARPGALARLPLGRGRPRRRLRRQAAALLRARAVERRRPDPEGAAVRPHQQRGQPRRGRQGVLLLPRRDADALVRCGTSTSTRSAPIRTTTWSTPTASAVARRAGVRAARHRRLRRRPLLRRLRRVREGGPRGPADPDHGLQPRPGRRAAAPAADAVVPQHLVARGRDAATRCCATTAASTGIAVIAASHPDLGEYELLVRRRRPSCSFTENETNGERLFGKPNASRYVKDGFHECVVHGARTR